MSSGNLIHLRKPKFTLKLVNVVSNVLNKVRNIEMPEKLKGTFVDRLRLYWKNIYVDYKATALDAVNSCKAHPLKTSTYISLSVSCMYLYKHNPDECSFKENFLQDTMKIVEVGQPIRNPVSESYIKWLGQCYNEGIVRCLNLGIFSLIWLDDYDETCTLYKTICPYLKPQYITFYQRAIDFGFLDKWWILESKMKDYDINEAEFNDVKT